MFKVIVIYMTPLVFTLWGGGGVGVGVRIGVGVGVVVGMERLVEFQI